MTTALFIIGAFTGYTLYGAFFDRVYFYTKPKQR